MSIRVGVMRGPGLSEIHALKDGDLVGEMTVEAIDPVGLLEGGPPRYGGSVQRLQGDALTADEDGDEETSRYYHRRIAQIRRCVDAFYDLQDKIGKDLGLWTPTAVDMMQGAPEPDTVIAMYRAAIKLVGQQGAALLAMPCTEYAMESPEDWHTKKIWKLPAFRKGLTFVGPAAYGGHRRGNPYFSMHLVGERSYEAFIDGVFQALIVEQPIGSGQWFLTMGPGSLGPFPSSGAAMGHLTQEHTKGRVANRARKRRLLT